MKQELSAISIVIIRINDVVRIFYLNYWVGTKVGRVLKCILKTIFSYLYINLFKHTCYFVSQPFAIFEVEINSIFLKLGIFQPNA